MRFWIGFGRRAFQKGLGLVGMIHAHDLERAVFFHPGHQCVLEPALQVNSPATVLELERPQAFDRAVESVGERGRQGVALLPIA